MSPRSLATRRPAAAIAGIGLTAQAKTIDSTTIEINVEAVRLALADAGMTLDDIRRGGSQVAGTRRHGVRAGRCGLDRSFRTIAPLGW